MSMKKMSMRMGYKFYKKLKKELSNLYWEWRKYINECFSYYLMRNKVALGVAVFCVFFLGFGVFLWFIKSVVYAQTDSGVINSCGMGLPLNKASSFIMGGVLLGAILKIIQRNYLIFKRLFDFAVAIVALVVLSPLFLIIAFIVRVDSSGPIFFKQERLGEKGKIFKMWKFRTMRNKAELETGPVWAQEDDPRMTRLGRFLRKSHLDELPQLFNVLRGNMSLIGPRPERPELLVKISKHIPDFCKRLDVKPGITGLAQVRYSYGASIKDAARKLKYDCIYMKRMCFFLDFQVLFWTVGRVLTGKGAR